MRTGNVHLSEGRREYQIKIRGSVDMETLFALKAEPLGQVLQEDIYIKGDEHALTWRIRKEHDRLLLTQKHHVFERESFAKVVKEKLVSSQEMEDMLIDHPIVVTVFKFRSLFRVQEAVIALDDVEYLGQFVEIKGESESQLSSVVATLDLGDQMIEHRSYLEMVTEQQRSMFLKMVLRLHHRVEELVFGLTSGVLTTIGVLVGVNAATASRISVISAIAAIGVADSYSDAYSMLLSKKSERGMSSKKALRHALWTFLGKFTLPTLLLIPIVLIDSLSAGVVVSVLLGIAVLVVVTL
jgi:predicted adenylyl cyclase CyaB